MTVDPPRPARSRWQFRLHTLFLLVAAIAVWMTYFLNRNRNARLEERIASMRPLVRELQVDDPEAIAVVKLEEHWYGESRWDLYLPGGDYRVGLATRMIGETGFPPSATYRSIPSGPEGSRGRHRIALEESKIGDVRRVTVHCDGSNLSVDEPESWYSGSNRASGDSFEISKQFPANQPVVLLRRWFVRPDARSKTPQPSGPTDGIMIWIEPVSPKTRG
jgi:hypothetical protein